MKDPKGTELNIGLLRVWVWGSVAGVGTSDV